MLMDKAIERKDKWGFEVLGRLESMNDTMSEEALYHVKCKALFDRGDNLPTNNKLLKCKHKIGVKREALLDKLCVWLDHNLLLNDCLSRYFA